MGDKAQFARESLDSIARVCTQPGELSGATVAVFVSVVLIKSGFFGRVCTSSTVSLSMATSTRSLAS